MIDLNKYSDFVEEVTSKPSLRESDFIAVLQRLNDADTDVNATQLLTGVMGLSSESGEAMEIVKKLLFQGKEYNEDVQFHLKRELGDIIWYWANTCRALRIDPNEVIEENIHKLESRYPGGKFDAHYSENRKENDL